MTLGEQIQRLRKAAGLSQEELGDRLGVARQSVSKWESDSTVPELEKLIAMSKLFGVSIGVLLGLEEPEGAGEELTQRELAAVEEIARRLTPAPAPEKKRNHSRAAALAVIAAVAAGVFLVGRMARMQEQLDQLQGRVAGINSDISSQISSLAGQVRNILEEQNQILAQSDYQILAVDLAGETVTFQLTATPKEYHEGMTALFTAAGTEFETVAAPGERGEGHSFSARLTCPLKDGISLSVGFTDGETTLTQILGQEWNLESDTQVSVYGHLNWSASGPADGPRRLTSLKLQANFGPGAGYKTASGYQEVTITEAAFHLWKGNSLVWSAPWENVGWRQSVEMEIPADGMTLAAGEELILSLLYTDSGGRTREVELDGMAWDNGDGSAVAVAPKDNGPYPWE